MYYFISVRAGTNDCC